MKALLLYKVAHQKAKQTIIFAIIANAADTPSDLRYRNELPNIGAI